MKCPGCGFELADEDLQGQVAHMQDVHPEIVAERLRAAGFEQLEDGNWADTLATCDCSPGLPTSGDYGPYTTACCPRHTGRRFAEDTR
jgi:hypothetical protein